MITREQLRELAQFEDKRSCAISFYFQPVTPRSKSHKEEAILAKDLAREALRQVEKTGKCESARADIDRIVRLLHDLLENGTHAKAVFACAAQNYWREYDLPPQLIGTQIAVDRNFQLKPLSQLLVALPRLAIVLADRHRARLFELRYGELTELEGFFQFLSRRRRSDGFAGYDGGHAQRRVADEARQHFKTIAGVLKDALDKGIVEKWILGCQEMIWPQIEMQLHSYVAQKLIGRFPSEVAHVNTEAIRLQAERIFADAEKNRSRQAVCEAISQARSNARGVTGLRRVLRALELGEVQTLLLGERYAAQAVQCSGCGHLDAHLVSFCPICGRETRSVVDVGEAILPFVIRHDIELLYVKDDSDFERVGSIAALLRYRAEATDNPQLHAEKRISVSRSGERRSGEPRAAEGRVGRYRGAAGG
jgi:peptide subunit release factor 1 (eRF1)